MVFLKNVLYQRTKQYPHRAWLILITFLQCPHIYGMNKNQFLCLYCLLLYFCLFGHALRTLLKKGNKDALRLFGLDDASGIYVQTFSILTNLH